MVYTEKQKEHYKKHKEYFKLYYREYYAKIRFEILEHYSNGKFECNCCGENELDFLTIDHINNNGNEHRKSKGSAFNIYQEIKRNNFPPEYQILCMNCNMSKGKRGTCIHKL
jgi:5-methylcytosine-specific restriction endonuclease McrA